MIKCEACRAFYYCFATSLMILNNTGARMLDSIYHMTLKFIKIAFLEWKRKEFAIIYATL